MIENFNQHNQITYPAWHAPGFQYPLFFAFSVYETFSTLAVQYIFWDAYANEHHLLKQEGPEFTAIQYDPKVLQVLCNESHTHFIGSGTL